MIPKISVLALAGTLAVWSVGCQPESTRPSEEPGSPPAKHEPGSPPDTKGGSGAQGEKGSTQREPGS